MGEPSPPSAWSLPYFGAAAFAGVMGGILFLRGRGMLRGGLLGLYLTFGFLMLAEGLLVASPDVASATRRGRFAVAVSILGAPAALDFAAALTGRGLIRLRWLAWLSLLPSAWLAIGTPWVVSGARLSPYGYASIAGPLFLVASSPLMLALCVPVIFFLQLRIERRPREREQLQVVLASSWITVLVFADYLPVFGLDVPPLGWLPIIVAMIGLGAAVVLHRLVDIGLGLRRAAVWIFLSFVSAIPFAALAGWLGPRLLVEHPLVAAIVAGVLIAGMRAHLLLFQPRLDRLFGRRRRDLDAELAWLASRAGTLLTHEELGRAIDRFLGALDRRLAALVVIDPSGRPRVALSAWGSVPPPARGSPLIAELSLVRALVSRDRVRGPARVEIERACVRWGAEYLGPLVEDERLIGIVAISPRAGGGVADAVEREALERMSVVATAALAGARLYERLRALSNELEQKAAARSAALAQALRDLRGAEQRLVESEKLASLGQIVAGVAADLRDCVHEAFDESARLRRQVALLMAKAAEAKAGPDARFDEMARDALPLLDAVSEGARRAYAIAADLSGFAGDDGVPSGTLRAARQATHLAALLDSTLTLCTRHLNDIAVVRDYDEALPMIPVEQGPLSQVVLNLILNATQAMRGSGTLTLSTRRVGEQAELGIGDTGPGIPPEILSRIFEPFFSTKGPTTGTGLGLSISYAIVKRHGGEIVVDTTVGVGTTFRVRLPLAAQAAHD